MNSGTMILENHSKSILCAEDALDFNYNESDEPNDSNENLMMPFTHIFQHPLRVKDLISVEATVLKFAKSFKIGLCKGKDDVVLHINPRLDQNYVARNSQTLGSWGPEESCSVTMSPIERGKPFQFQIFVLEKEFMISINGNHMFSYQHRIPFQEINRIEIFGDIDFTKVALTKTPFYPLPCTKQEFTLLNSNLSLPLTCYMKDGLEYYYKISIKGRVKLLPVSFTINVQTTEKVYPHPNIIYHLNGRYSGDGYLVENSWGLRREGWNTEVRSPLPSALQPGNSFSLNISCTNGHIQTDGPGWKLPPFYHRLDPKKGVFLYIQGDIIIDFLKIYPDRDNVFVI